MSVQTRPIYSSGSDRGRVRQNNEDAVYAATFGEQNGTGRGWTLLVVADGVGGFQRGEWASQTAIATLVQELPRRLEGTPPGQALPAALQMANEQLWRQSSGDQSLRGAATTLTAVLTDGEQLWWSHVGDSRAYLVRAGQTQPLTHDHSLVAEQVRAGRLTPEQARQSNQRNVITRAVGYEQSLQVDSGGPLPVQDGDRVVLCSDGLHGLVGDGEIGQVTTSLAPDWAVQRLVALSNERGGPDNISVVVCAFDGDQALVTTNPAGVPAAVPSRRRLTRIIGVGVLLLIGLAAGVPLVLSLINQIAAAPATPTVVLATAETPAAATPSGSPSPTLTVTPELTPTVLPAAGRGTVTPTPPPTASPSPTALTILAPTVTPTPPLSLPSAPPTAVPTQPDPPAPAPPRPTIQPKPPLPPPPPPPPPKPQPTRSPDIVVPPTVTLTPQPTVVPTPTIYPPPSPTRTAIPADVRPSPPPKRDDSSQ